MNVPENIYMPESAKDHIKALLPYGTDFRPNFRGGWTFKFSIKEDAANWDFDENFLKENNLTLAWEYDRGHFSSIAGYTQTPIIHFTMTYEP